MAFAHPDHLVSTSWLQDHLDDPSVRILDVTAKLNASLDNAPATALFEAAHIPGSVLFDIASGTGALSDGAADLPWMWPGPDQFAATMTAAGVGTDTRVVLVARTPRPGIDSGTMWCTRAWWTMHHYGVDCAILHGGVEAWEREGRPLDSGPAAAPDAPGTALVPADGWQAARATTDDVLAVATGDAAGATCLVDALSTESFAGTDGGYGGRPGHIPGAVNVPMRELIVEETCGFVDEATMRTVLGDAGLLDADRVITYCGGAIAATVDAFCLALLGHESVAVYDGSLMEWTADPQRPMVGPAAG